MRGPDWLVRLAHSPVRGFYQLVRAFYSLVREFYQRVICSAPRVLRGIIAGSGGIVDAARANL